MLTFFSKKAKAPVFSMNLEIPEGEVKSVKLSVKSIEKLFDIRNSINEIENKIDALLDTKSKRNVLEIQSLIVTYNRFMTALNSHWSQFILRPLESSQYEMHLTSRKFEFLRKKYPEYLGRVSFVSSIKAMSKDKVNTFIETVKEHREKIGDIKDLLAIMSKLKAGISKYERGIGHRSIPTRIDMKYLGDHWESYTGCWHKAKYYKETELAQTWQHFDRYLAIYLFYCTLEIHKSATTKTKI